MRIQNYRLSDRPYINEFSGKEFNYKLMNMCKTIGNERLVNMMLLNSNYLTHPAFKNEEMEIPEKLLFKIFNINIKHNRQNFKNLKDKLPQSKEIIMLHIIQNIKQIGPKTSAGKI